MSSTEKQIVNPMQISLRIHFPEEKTLQFRSASVTVF